jgi:hypothetical protein
MGRLPARTQDEQSALDAYVKRVVDKAPPLNQHQKEILISAFAPMRDRLPAEPKKSKRQIMIDDLVADLETPNDFD